MAKINDQVETTPIVEKNNTNEINSMLQEFQAMKQEIAQLKSGKENMFQNARNKYEGPHKYSYKLWAGVPVLSYVSRKKDASKDLIYRHPNGEFISNHYLDLVLANGKEISIEVTEFNSAFTRSDKEFATLISDGVTTIGYKFKNQEFGEFIVNRSIIN